MESLDGIATLHMSGSRAVFVPSAGSALSEQSIADAIREQGLKFTSLESLERKAPGATYLVDAGVT